MPAWQVSPEAAVQTSPPVGLVDSLAEHEEEVAGGVELLDPVVAGIGDVDVVAGLIDFDVGRSGERIGVGGSGAGRSVGAGVDVR